MTLHSNDVKTSGQKVVSQTKGCLGSQPFFFQNLLLALYSQMINITITWWLIKALATWSRLWMAASWTLLTFSLPTFIFTLYPPPRPRPRPFIWTKSVMWLLIRPWQTLLFFFCLFCFSFMLDKSIDLFCFSHSPILLSFSPILLSKNSFFYIL